MERMVRVELKVLVVSKAQLAPQAPKESLEEPEMQEHKEKEDLLYVSFNFRFLHFSRIQPF